jgi:hypothetical protein
LRLPAQSCRPAVRKTPFWQPSEQENVSLAGFTYDLDQYE